MAKDPAVLFYFQDFLVGTEFMTDDEVGKYIRILCHQADKGSLSEMQILRICRTNKIPEVIKEKLNVDSEGKYYQERMRIEKEKRQKHCEHQRENINKRWNKSAYHGNTAVLPLLNENENENINEDEDIIKEKKETLKNEKLRLVKEHKKQFALHIGEFKSQYPDGMLLKFYNYWSEMNKSGTQMRWEMEKTWELSKRLTTWASREKDFKKPQELISHKELIERFNNGEVDIWEKYENIKLNGKYVWKRKETA